MTFYGTGLSGEEFIPEQAQAVLIIVHGLGEHRGRYSAITERLNMAGIACINYDQRGHGESPGKRTDIDNFSEFTDDLLKVVQATKAARPTMPLFLWGHSLGSIVVLSYLLKNPDDIRGVVTSSCPLFTVPGPVVSMSKSLSKISNLLPTIRVGSRLDPKLLSHEESVQKAYKQDEMVTHSVTLELVFEMSAVMNKLKKRVHDIYTPWFGIHGSEDEIAPPEGSRFLFENLGSNDKKLEIIDTARHEIHNESDHLREQFLELVSHWIQERSV